MTEQEYIDATDLANVRAACRVFRDISVLSLRKGDYKRALAVNRALSKFEESLTRRVKCTEGGA